VNPTAHSRGPSPLLPLAYLAAAALAFVLAAASVPWLAFELAGHYYQPRLLALTHVVTLGWITLTIMGAAYQILPIVLGRPVWSERLARWQLALTAVGIAGMVGHFFVGSWPGFLWAAGLVTLGVGAHLANAAFTARGLRQWTFTARLVAFAHVGLGLTAAVGVLLAIDKVAPVLSDDLFPRLHAHVHLALLGWVLPMVIAVAARVYPLFLLAPEPAGWPARAQLWGLALGVPATVIGIVASPGLLAAGALSITVALVGHLVWIAGMVRGRRRPALDWGLRFVLTGALALVPAAALGLALAFGLLAGPRAALAYATLAFGGWASLTIVGMLLKIVPFLVWSRAYASRVGREPVPTLPDLGWPAGERVAWVLLTAGIPALAGALWLGEPVWIRAAGLVVTAGALAFAGTLGHVLQHLRACARRPVVALAARPEGT
jgi:Cytochrome C and Quinol oxidase polypeptide I